MKRSSSVPAVAWPLLALGILLLANVLWTPHFLSFEIRDGRLFGPLIDIVHRAAPVALLAVGMTLVIATGGIDLSVGAVMAIAAAVAAVLLTSTDAASGTVVLAALAVAAAFGLGNGILVAAFRIQPIVATLILMVAGRGIAQLLTEGQIVTFHDPFLEFLGSGSLLGLPTTFFLAGGVLLLVLGLTRWTPLGSELAAIGAGERAARAAGIATARRKLFAYSFCGACAGLAGLIAAADIRAADANNIGLYLELDAILAVVLGGTALTGGRFHLAGSVIGALILQTLTTMILMRGVGIEYTLVFKGAIVIGILVVQSPRTRRTVLRLTARRAPAQPAGPFPEESR